MDIQENTPEQITQRQVGKLGDEAISLFLDKKPLLTHYGASLTIGGIIRQLNLNSLTLTHGKAYVGMFLVGVLKEFLGYVPNSLTPEQVVQYADNIMASFPEWAPEDLILCLKNGMSGKYGPTPYHWKWNPNFIEWAQKHNQEKYNYHVDDCKKKQTEGALRDAEIISLFPKELFENFAKVPFADKAKEKMLDIKIPNDVAMQGPEAVDAWIDKIKIKNK